jgi:hypothetical protein
VPTKSPAVEIAKATVEARKPARRYVSQEDRTRDFLVAKRAEVDRLEALALRALEANPCSKSADDAEEAQWRELAHASRQMRPLLEAIERAARQPDYEKYKDGFDFRLTEAMATVATLCSYERLQPLNRQKVARKPRPKAKSPYTKFINDRLKYNPHAGANEIKRAFLDDTLGGGTFELSKDRLTILMTDGSKRQLKVSGIAAAVAKARKRMLRK